MDAAELARRMERERLFWVDVAPGKRIQFLRPLMDEARAFTAGMDLPVLCTYLRDWTGIVESDLLKQGGETPGDFNLANATTVLRDNFDWAAKVAKALMEALSARAQATQEAEKNSAPS